jgi:hypothetical protein
MDWVRQLSAKIFVFYINSIIYDRRYQAHVKKLVDLSGQSSDDMEEHEDTNKSAQSALCLALVAGTVLLHIG